MLLDARTTDADDVNSPMYPARNFLKALREQNPPPSRARGPHGVAAPLATVDRQYIMQLCADSRRLAREALKRQGCLEIAPDGATYAKKPCPTRHDAMQEA